MQQWMMLMWQKIKNSSFARWISKYPSPVVILIVAASVSLSVGILIAGLSYFLPALLAGIAGITILGFAPLAFLSTLSLPLALLSIAGIMSGLTFSCLMVLNQIVNISYRIANIFTDEEEEVPLPGSPYDNKYLKKISRTTSFNEDNEFNSAFIPDLFSSSEELTRLTPEVLDQKLSNYDESNTNKATI